MTNAPTPSPAAAAPPCFARPLREAHVTWVRGVRARFLVDGSDTGGRMSMQEFLAPAFNPGPPLHSHDDAEELFHVLDGALKVVVADQIVVARAGDTLIVPRRTLHTFSNPYLTACRFITQLTPAGFEGFFREIGVPPAAASDALTPPPESAPDPARLRALAVKYHMRVPGLTD